MVTVRGVLLAVWDRHRTLSGSDAGRRFTVRLSIANPTGYTLKGKLNLKAKRLRLGSKSFSIRAGSREVLKVQLSGKAFRTLKRRRRMAALATAKVSGPIGKSRTVKKKVSIKAPSKPKRKRSGGGGGGGVRTPRCWAQPQLLPDGTYHPNPCAFVAGRP